MVNNCTFSWEVGAFSSIMGPFVLVMNDMARSDSSKKWLQEHFNDVYVKKAQVEGYRSRAVYKLKEIDAKECLFKPGMIVVDLGASPGGWTQFVAEQLDGRGRIVALDILPMDALPGVEFVLGDFKEDAVVEQLMQRFGTRCVDIVLSDMSPNLSGHVAIDIPRAMLLVELSLEFATTLLKPGGTLLTKVFHGAGFDAFVKQVRSQFSRVVIRKPAASRSRSRETYLLAKGYKL